VRKPAPEVLVCTPAFLSGYGGMRNIPLFVKARVLVIDEADMLMEGDYGKQLQDILTGQWYCYYKGYTTVAVQLEQQ
jgi:superfamily II DNA/RNA helicase